MTVGKHKIGHLYPIQIFLYHHLRSCRAETSAEDTVQGRLRFLQIRRYDYTLACSQTVSLDHIRRSETTQKIHCLVFLTCHESTVCRCRYAMTGHELLGKILAALQFSSVTPGSHEKQFFFQSGRREEKIPETAHQRILRSADYHVYVIFHHSIEYQVEVPDTAWYSGSQGIDSWIAGKSIEISQQWTLSDLPGQSMFPATRAQQQYIVLHIFTK